MRKVSFKKQQKYCAEICNRFSWAIIKKKMKIIPFILYHLVKQCPEGKICKEIRKKDYTNVYKYFQNKAFKLNKKQIEKCIKKLDELIL